MPKARKTFNCSKNSHSLAARQARAHANLARGLIAELDAADNLGLPEVLALLVNASFAIELYFKALVLMANNGTFKEGHRLAEILNDLPRDVLVSLSKGYNAYFLNNSVTAYTFASTLGDCDQPPSDGVPEFSIATFSDAIASVSNVFVEARYFFEAQSEDGFSFIWYPRGSLIAIMDLLEKEYSDRRTINY